MTARPILRFILAAAFLAAGILHLLVPTPFLGITPVWVPFAPAVIAVTGIAELAGAVGLMIPRLRQAAGIGLALYAVCVFPANIQHAVSDLALSDPQLGWAYHGPRLLFQPVIVWWALWAGEVIDWPFRRRQAA
ncbi:DoxX family protein [Brevundimonas subvibrioides]|uniref:DoxX family protein n=1 Tax=Brevundimonas subvibrioides (strain ATCC 15264 / DSM 4735 / LMG 14903 / NBRC 16000 / CB 81) TaxID=633149 RepID=D9QFL0_BRESC|nr:DoxX family protein [Brevundimonas subvibrioides]ADL02525.1 conserved hypothetical protein [Brevundimonas subvibrioides ATCC 15264]